MNDGTQILDYAEAGGSQAMRRLEMPDSEASQSASLDDAVAFRLRHSQTLEDAAAVLYQLLTGGYAVWEDGRLYYAKALVAVVGPLRIEVRLREHAPPHFHAAVDDRNASFTIRDCTYLNGSITSRDRHLVEYWYRNGGRRLVVESWNTTRPTDCPVGPIED